MPQMMKNIGLDFDVLVEDDPISLQFSQNGFESKQFLVNIGSTLFFIVIYLAMWVILLLLMRMSSIWPLFLPVKTAL
jgi:hypothetical protein